MNGRIEYSVDTSAPFDFATAATYSCNEGFFLEGNEIRNCGGDGSSMTGLWDGTAPVCTGLCIAIVLYCLWICKRINNDTKKFFKMFI